MVTIMLWMLLLILSKILIGKKGLMLKDSMYSIMVKVFLFFFILRQLSFHYSEEWTQHDQKIAKIREERETRREEYEQKIIAEKEKVEEARKRYYDAIKAQG